ncbi:MAG: hypothetical protein HY508_00945 [Acidobacteria bacterium]|nr:hypothetical protein [Acidobacteriota bacterium]
MGILELQPRPPVAVTEYIQRAFVPLSRLAHDWQTHSAVPLTPAEDRTIVREPAAAVPDAVAQRIGKLRVLVVPYVACAPEGDQVAWAKPQGEAHSAVWMEGTAHIDLILPCRELDAHDTGFEFLASVAELLRARLQASEIERYTQLILEELRLGVPGEIDEEARAAKRSVASGQWRRAGDEKFEAYRNVSFVSTAAEYMHGLWHDVQIHVGPEHLPVKHLRNRMKLLAEMFPPNPGYSVFSRELENEQQPE